MSLARQIIRLIKEHQPPPVIHAGTVVSVASGLVIVEIGDQRHNCDRSTVFDADITASGYQLLGATVEVHFIARRRPVVAYRIITMGA